MTRKIVTLIAALLLTVPGFAARYHRAPVSPYQYGRRWYFSLQGGPMFGFNENLDSYFANGKGWNTLTFYGAAAIGYNFNDAWDLRISGSYSYNAGACLPQGSFYPYTFRAAHAFADLILNFRALGEDCQPFSPKMYLGLGGAYTHGFSDPGHPFQLPNPENLCPGFRVGVILERDYPGGFGWFFDFGAESFLGWYSGLEPTGVGITLELRLSFGIVVHFWNPKIKLVNQ